MDDRFVALLEEFIRTAKKENWSTTENDSIGSYECHGYKGNDVQPDYVSGQSIVKIPSIFKTLLIYKQIIEQAIEQGDTDLFDSFKEVDYTGQNPEWNAKLQVFENRKDKVWEVYLDYTAEPEEEDYELPDKDEYIDIARHEPFELYR